MHGYDVALKLLFQSPNSSILTQVTGGKIEHWLTAELPQVQTSRADLLGETIDGTLVHVELQTTNDPEMALRMIEYGLRIFRKLKQYPKQIVVYVGEAPMRMPSSLSEPKSASPVVEFHYTLIDIRELDGSALMASPHIADNLMAVLTPLQNRIAAIREILGRIAKLPEPARRDALARFLLISGLRRLAPVVKEEVEKMPILNDILDHEVFGPVMKEGLEKGRQEGLEKGRQEGLQEGRQQGASRTLRQILSIRFGNIPAGVSGKLEHLSVSELEDLVARALNVERLDDLFPGRN